MKRFCYRKPHFPRHAFVATLMFEKEGEVVMANTLSQLYTSIAAFRYDLKLLMQVTPQMDDMIADHVIAIPVVFQKLWPLKKEYWDSPDLPFSGLDRQKMFIESIQTPEFYTLLATPLKFTKPFTQTTAVCPFRSSSSDAAIELFMKTSNYPVPEIASHAALYSLEKSHGINWKTGEILPRLKTIKALNTQL